jgi:hypothetical protein
LWLAVIITPALNFKTLIAVDTNGVGTILEDKKVLILYVDKTEAKISAKISDFKRLS